jgi:cytochrome d ubiquinol oxidase subunit I
MELSGLLVSRLQFAFTIIFHIIFPTFSIGLSAYIATLCVLWMHRGKAHYRLLAQFWTKIFAVAFAMGVVSGIVLTYQFGTNWSRFSAAFANVVGPMMGYEVLAAFFLEATFLGIMLFGWKRVPPWLHSLSAVIVALGTLLSAFWILSANSWMQTPVGYEMRDGVAFPLDWLAIVFNPSFPYRLAHMVTAAYLTTSFVVLAVGARYALNGRHPEHAHTMLRMAVGFAAIVAPLQLIIGDQHGLNTLRHQPLKIAAMEAHWDGTSPGELVLFAWPDETAETNRFAVTIPHGASLVLTHSWDGLFPGLKDVPPQDRPPVLPPFFAFRAMVAIGVLMILAGWTGAWLAWKGRLFDARWYLWPAQHVWWIGFVAVICGWIVTETGRQPWVAYGLLRTADAVSPLAAGTVTASLMLFVLVYCVVFATGIYTINRLIARGPQGEPGELADSQTPASPLPLSLASRHNVLVDTGP